MKLSYAHKTIDAEQAIEVANNAAIKAKLSPSERKLIEAYLLAIPHENGYRLDQIFGFLDNLRRALTNNDPSFLEMRRGFKSEKQVDVIEWVESREYLAQTGFVWDATKDSLWKIFHGKTNPFEIILTGAAGTGKSWVTVYSFSYILYLVSNMWNPPLEFRSLPGSEFFLVFQSLKLETVMDALFTRLRRLMDASKYVQENFQRNQDINNRLLFPHNFTVLPLTGNTTSALGKDIFSIGFSELNFSPVIKGSVKLQHSSKNLYDVAKEMYTHGRNRIKTRFSQIGGGFPGKLIVDSARNYVGDFTDQKIQEAKDDPTILVIQRTLWEARAHDYPPSEEVFFVEIGDDHRPTKVVNSRKDAVDPNNVVKVPMRHFKDFKNDPEQAAKDLIGTPSSAIGRFIPFRKEITACQDKYIERFGEKRLFKRPTISFRELFGNLDQGGEVDWGLIIDYDYLDCILDKEGQTWACHVDTSISGDATGLALVRIVDTKIVDHHHVWISKENTVKKIDNVEAPIYLADGILQIIAIPGEQINLNLVRDLVRELRRHLNIKYASADWVESWSMILSWRSDGIMSDRVSVDKTPQAYYELRHSIREGRLIFPPHEVCDKEIRRLRRVIQANRIKIDHPENESKDCSDALAGAIGVLQRCEARFARHEYGILSGKEPIEAIEIPGDIQYRNRNKERTTRPKKKAGGVKFRTGGRVLI